MSGITKFLYLQQKKRHNFEIDSEVRVYLEIFYKSSVELWIRIAVWR